MIAAQFAGLRALPPAMREGTVSLVRRSTLRPPVAARVNDAREDRDPPLPHQILRDGTVCRGPGLVLGKRVGGVAEGTQATGAHPFSRANMPGGLWQSSGCSD